jgi:hypothetical protein
VTAVLAVAGAVIGAVCGALLMAVADVIHFGTASLRDPIAEGVAAEVGALLGGVLAPVASFLLMRHVPLWRAIAETTLGACAGALLGLLLGRVGKLEILWGLIGAVVGFLVAAVRLRIVSKTATRAELTPPAVHRQR